MTNILNYNRAHLNKLKAALGKVMSGRANARILCIGPSGTFGFGSNGTNIGDMHTAAYPTQLAAMLNKTVSSHANAFMGCGGSPNNTINLDPRITISGAMM